MKKEILKTDGRSCSVYSMEKPSALLIQPMGQQEVAGMDCEVELIARKCGRQFAMAAFDIVDWFAELTPWPDPVVSKSPEVGKQADATLAYIEKQLLPCLRRRFGNLPCILGGYSLGALFALWAAYKSDIFSGVAASSPSVWIKDWLHFTAQHQMKARHVYLSLGDREKFTRNKAIAQVGSNIREYHQTLVAQLGEENTTLKWNAGSHFKNAAVRTADGFAWNMKSLC